MCFSGSNQISDYTGDGQSRLCSDGHDKYHGGQLVIDVHQIDKAISVHQSSMACMTRGKDYFSQADLRLTCSVISSGDISLDICRPFLLIFLV